MPLRKKPARSTPESLDLGKLPVFLPGSTIPVGPLLQHLAQRNLLRGYLLSIPTGQAMADGMQTKPLTARNCAVRRKSAIHNAVVGGGFD